MLIFYHCSHLFAQNPAQLVKNLEVWVIFGDSILASLFGDGKIQITVYLSITVSKIQKTVIRSNLVWLHIHMIWTISISTSISISKSKSNLVRLHVSVNHPQPPLLVQSLCQGQPVLPVEPLVGGCICQRQPIFHFAQLCIALFVLIQSDCGVGLQEWKFKKCTWQSKLPLMKLTDEVG